MTHATAITAITPTIATVSYHGAELLPQRKAYATNPADSGLNGPPRSGPCRPEAADAVRSLSSPFHGSRRAAWPYIRRREDYLPRVTYRGRLTAGDFFFPRDRAILLAIDPGKAAFEQSEARIKRLVAR